MDENNFHFYYRIGSAVLGIFVVLIFSLRLYKDNLKHPLSELVMVAGAFLLLLLPMFSGPIHFKSGDSEVQLQISSLQSENSQLKSTLNSQKITEHEKDKAFDNILQKINAKAPDHAQSIQEIVENQDAAASVGLNTSDIHDLKALMATDRKISDLPAYLARPVLDYKKSSFDDVHIDVSPDIDIIKKVPDEDKTK